MRHAYGERRDQFGELTRPEGTQGPWPVAVLIHGGYWRAKYDLRMEDPLVPDLGGRGWAVWNLEYRRSRGGSRLSKQTMTTMVRLLERDGLVTRERDAEDRRAFRVRLTARAREFKPEARAVLRELHGRVGERLGRKRREALREALKEVMQL